jgi:hypothetical protein
MKQKQILHTTTSPKSHAGLVRLVTVMTAASAVVIVLLPFHGFLTVWGASLVGHYTLLRLWKEFIVTGLLIGCIVLLLWGRAVDEVWSGLSLRQWRRRPLGFVMITYLLLLLVTGLVAYVRGAVTLKALANGLLLDGRFVVFFGISWLLGHHTQWITNHWRPLVLGPAVVVVIFGILQFTLLPANFLSHFGYGPHTISAIETVDQKTSYQRVQSTLRGANPLGAYLVIIISALGALLLGQRTRRWRYGLLLLASIVVLGLTFSRSAWIGTIAALIWLAWEAIGSRRLRHRLLLVGCIVVVLLGGVSFALRSNDVFQNTFFHHDEQSQTAGSDQGHLAATRAGLVDIMRQPLGGGTGTAGPASVNNNRPPRIAEDYFIQIGQEAGLLGLGLFIAINLLVGRRLFMRRDRLLAQILLASLVGISLVNLLSHAWTDDTLSYIWWGLAGAACALPLQPSTEPASNLIPRSVSESYHFQAPKR